jgi:Fic family protein
MAEPLTEAEVEALDRAYEPFPAFAEWIAQVPRAEVWDDERARLMELIETASEEQVDRALEIVMRAAAVDTGAIEGLYRTDRGITRTVALQSAMWEATLEEAGPGAVDLFQAQLGAFELVLDASTSAVPITEAWIRRLHEELTAPQETYVVDTAVGRQEQPLPRGEYKRYPNHVHTADGSAHSYAPVLETPSEMGRLVAELQSEAFSSAHPIAQASYAHYALAAIHPFADGNGRVARALASVYTYRAARTPLLVLVDQRAPYLVALAEADAGAHGAFVSFVRGASHAALAMVAETLKAAVAPDPAAALERIRDLFSAQAGLSHAQMDDVARRVLEEFRMTMLKRIEELEFPPGVDIVMSAGSGVVSVRGRPSGFRAMVENPAYVPVTFTSAPPAAASVDSQFTVSVSTAKDEAEAFRLESTPDLDALTFGLRDVYPEIGMAGQQRITAFVDRILGTKLAELEAAATEALHNTGYSA